MGETSDLLSDEFSPFKKINKNPEEKHGQWNLLENF
jgi:hypothetical protein